MSGSGRIRSDERTGDVTLRVRSDVLWAGSSDVLWARCGLGTGPTVVSVIDPPGDPLMVELAVRVTDVEIVSDWLWRHGTSAVVEDIDGSDADLGVDIPSVDISSVGVVHLLADLPADLATLLVAGEIVDPVVDSVISASIRGTADDDSSVAQSWRDYAEPRVCGRVLITPVWLPADTSSVAVLPGDLVEVLMEPGKAFGSGTHVTTRLCVEAAGAMVTGGESVLDFGCGTGILGVAAALLGANSVVAIDIDDEAVTVTRELVRMNGVADRFDVSGKSLVEVQGEFDLVFANVPIGVITEFGSTLVDKVAPGGALVVSGVLGSQVERAVTALAPLRVEVDKAEDDWSMLVLRRPV